MSWGLAIVGLATTNATTAPLRCAYVTGGIGAGYATGADCMLCRLKALGTRNALILAHFERGATCTIKHASRASATSPGLTSPTPTLTPRNAPRHPVSSDEWASRASARSRRMARVDSLRSSPSSISSKRCTTKTIDPDFYMAHHYDELCDELDQEPDAFREHMVKPLLSLDYRSYDATDQRRCAAQVALGGSGCSWRAGQKKSGQAEVGSIFAVEKLAKRYTPGYPRLMLMQATAKEVWRLTADPRGLNLHWAGRKPWVQLLSSESSSPSWFMANGSHSLVPYLELATSYLRACPNTAPRCAKLAWCKPAAQI
ncbi:hypothetical protein T492DRAFT_1133832 [Pavlovales sp. CCMP2436]|nr:hypothetical protein T492DRAFT_1133832 [Pavlovales sp. CCMP2436]